MTRASHISLFLAILLLILPACTGPSHSADQPVVTDDGGTVVIDGDALSDEVHQHFADGRESIPFAAIQRDLEKNVSPDIDLDQLARQVHQYVNSEREAHDLQPVAWADSLHEVAAIHSQDMAEHEFFAHEDTSGRTVNERAQDVGYQCHRQLDQQRTAIGFAENLAKQSLFSDVSASFSGSDRAELRELRLNWASPGEVARRAVHGWMSSVGHRENILTEHHQVQAIAAARSEENIVYITQILC